MSTKTVITGFELPDNGVDGSETLSDGTQRVTRLIPGGCPCSGNCGQDYVHYGDNIDDVALIQTYAVRMRSQTSKDEVQEVLALLSEEDKRALSKYCTPEDGYYVMLAREFLRSEAKMGAVNVLIDLIRNIQI